MAFSILLWERRRILERRHPCLLASVRRPFLSRAPHPKCEQARTPALPGVQKTSFKANWSCRESIFVLVITP